MRIFIVYHYNPNVMITSPTSRPPCHSRTPSTDIPLLFQRRVRHCHPCHVNDTYNFGRICSHPLLESSILSLPIISYNLVNSSANEIKSHVFGYKAVAGANTYRHQPRCPWRQGSKPDSRIDGMGERRYDGRFETCDIASKDVVDVWSARG